MAHHFLTKTQIALENCLRVRDETVLEQYDNLAAILRDRIGGQTASLFAEPLLSRGNDTAPASVSWYSEYEGRPRTLASLPIAVHGAVETYLADTLGPVRTLLDDPQAGPLLQAALWQMEVGDIIVVNSRPVLINWGMRPSRLGGDPSALSAHYAATLGRFLPLATPPGLEPAVGQASGAAPLAAAAMAGVGAALVSEGAAAAGIDSDNDPTAAETELVTGAEPVTTEVTASTDGAVGGQSMQPSASAGSMPGAGSDDPLPKAAWVPLVILLVLALATLVWLLLPNTRLFANDRVVPVIADDAAVALAEQVNRDLAEQRAALKAAVDGAVCLPDGTLVTPDGRTPQGLLPPANLPGETPAPGFAPGDQTEAAPDAILPADPQRVRVPETNGSGEPTTTSLLEVIEQRTVLVLAIDGGSLSNGTGFVVGPGLIMTNDHVITEAAGAGGTILVAHKSFAEPSPAQVLKTLGPLEAMGGDFALLQIPNSSLPAYQIHLSQESLKLTNVIAAGFPGDVLATDSGFNRLVEGDLSSMPELTVTDGAVSTEQDLSPTTRVLVHSAPLSNGNSGGPLVDFCGRVVGVNTFVRAGDLRTLNFALASSDLMSFLETTSASPTVLSSSCTPQIARPAPTRAAAPLEAPSSESSPPELPKSGEDE